MNADVLNAIRKISILGLIVFVSLILMLVSIIGKFRADIFFCGVTWLGTSIIGVGMYIHVLFKGNK